MDAYQAWLQEQIAYWHTRCLESAAERGRPASEGARYADERLRDILETYEECLANYEALMIRPTQPGYPSPALPDPSDVGDY